MSFAKGFGNAFAQGFGGQLDRMHQEERDAAAREDDMFKMKFQLHVNRREEYDKAKKADAGYVNHAKRIANEIGVDPKAVPTIAQALAQGADEKYVIEKFKHGEWDFTNVKPLVETPKIDTQTEAMMGNATPANQDQSSTPRQKPSWFQKDLNPSGKDFPDAPKKTQDAQLAEFAGVDEAELYASSPATTGYEDNGAVFTGAPAEAEIPSEGDAFVALQRATAALDADPENPQLQDDYRKAKIDAEGHQVLLAEKAAQEAIATGKSDPRLGIKAKVRDPQSGKLLETLTIRQDPQHPGQYIDNKGRVLSEAEFQNLDVIGDDEVAAQADARKYLGTKKEYNDYQAASRSLTSMTEDLAVLDTLIKDNPRLLDEGYITTAMLADSGIRNAASFYRASEEAMGTFFGTEGESEIPANLVAEAEDIVSKWDETTISSDADAATLFKARTLLAGYKLGKTLGQTGNALAEKERVALMGAVAAGHDVPTFRKNAGNIIASLEGDVDRAADVVMSDPTLVGFEQDHGYFPVEKLGKWREVNGDNPKVQHMLSVTANPEEGLVTQPQAGDPAAPTPAPEGATNDPQMDLDLMQDLKAMTREERIAEIKRLRPEYDADHGPGSFDRNVLRRGQ